MKNVKSFGMVCPYCGGLRYDDNSEEHNEKTNYQCRSCGGRWTWDTLTHVQTYDNGNGGTTTRLYDIEEGPMYLTSEEVPKLVNKEAYLEYLERCARSWELPPHNSPEQAALVRARAQRIQEGR